MLNKKRNVSRLLQYLGEFTSNVCRHSQLAVGRLFYLSYLFSVWASMGQHSLLYFLSSLPLTAKWFTRNIKLKHLIKMQIEYLGDESKTRQNDSHYSWIQFHKWSQLFIASLCKCWKEKDQPFNDNHQLNE